MFKKLLVAYDGSEDSERPWRWPWNYLGGSIRRSIC